jgi:putative transposase
MPKKRFVAEQIVTLLRKIEVSIAQGNATPGGVAMTDMFLLSEAQMRRIEPFFPLSHGVPRVDDRRVISGIVFVIRNGLRWRDAPRDYGPHKTIYNRFVRWSRLGVFNKIFAELARKAGKPRRLAASLREPIRCLDQAAAIAAEPFLAPR